MWGRFLTTEHEGLCLTPWAPTKPTQGGSREGLGGPTWGRRGTWHNTTDKHNNLSFHSFCRTLPKAWDLLFFFIALYVLFFYFLDNWSTQHYLIGQIFFFKTHFVCVAFSQIRILINIYLLRELLHLTFRSTVKLQSCIW